MLSIDLLAIFTVKTSVMNLLLFLFVLLFSFFSVKDQIASFQLEEIVGQFHVRQWNFEFFWIKFCTIKLIPTESWDNGVWNPENVNLIIFGILGRKFYTKFLHLRKHDNKHKRIAVCVYNLCLTPSLGHKLLYPATGTFLRKYILNLCCGHYVMSATLRYLFSVPLLTSLYFHVLLMLLS